MQSEGRPIAKRHHTVPQFYLRGFARDGQVTTVRLPGQHRFPQSVRDASVANNFYSVAGHPDGADVFERDMADVEGDAAPIFDRVARGAWPLGKEDRMTLGYFVALQAVRITSHRSTMDYVYAQVLRLQVGAGGKAGVRRKLEEKGQPVTDDLVDRLWTQATRPEGPPVKWSQIEHLQHIVSVSEELLKYIVGRPWSLMSFDRRSLITSDSPVGLVGHPDEEPWRGVGFMTAWGITFPLSRKQGLLLGSIDPLIELGVPVEQVHEGRADTMLEGTTKFEKFFNSHTVDNANQWLFHHPDDAKFVPPDLPDPRPVTVEMSGVPREFTGEPWFKGK